MRLIDANKLMESLDPKESVWVGLVLSELIANAPTVEAIPIELYEQVKGERDVAIEQLKSLNIELFERPYLKAILIEWIEKKLNCCDNINAEIFVKSLIRDWRKENGRS